MSSQPAPVSGATATLRDPKGAATADGDEVVPINVEDFGLSRDAAFGAPTTSGTAPGPVHARVPLRQLDAAVARRGGTPWEDLCRRRGISAPTARRRYYDALSVIAWRLNRGRVHHGRGRSFVIRQVR